ncbi:MAG: hypothetical protein IT320_07695 [Anaerolineae bacterium]|nr:hypothetical protein [Anaerolineae bacterium]
MTDQKRPQIPEPLWRRHPELPAVFQALQEFESGADITARCYKCDALLSVQHFEPIRTIWVKCPNGCTVYREMKAADEG